MKDWSWERDDFDSNGKLILLYRHQRIITEGLVKKGDIVLDVGGWGKLAYRLFQEGCCVTLVNNDKNKCEEIKLKYPNTFKVICGDVRKLSSFINYTFDVVTCFETLEHIIEGRKQAIQEIFCVLKPNGVFVGTVPIPGYCHPIDDPTISFCYPEELEELVRPYVSEFKIEKTASVNPTGDLCCWYFYGRKYKAK